MKKNIFIRGIMSIILLAACETRLDLGPVANKKRLVVNALVNNRDFITVQVSSTVPLGSGGSIAFIENATVTVKDETGSTFNLVYNIGTSKYESTLKPQPGKYYSVTVSAPGYTDAFSELVMPETASALKPEWKDSTGFDTSGFPTGRITVKINDKGGVKNFYRISLFYYDDFLAEWKTLKPNSTDAEISQSAITAEDGGILFTDRSFDGQVRDIPFVTPFGFTFITPKFLVVTESLSENYYRYFNSLQNYREPGGVFTEATPVFSNIRNGVGIWAGSSMVRDTIR